MPLLGEIYVLTALVEGWPAGTRVVVVEADDEGAVGVRPVAVDVGTGGGSFYVPAGNLERP